ncbi:MAG: class I SAM-dependent methyltransferase [Mariprofundaceae bacterium]|nr:class I SAM-dependent methyltransferase [Mariprofundaceae bacterium]
MVDGNRIITRADALGRPDAQRYVSGGGWPVVLLERMVYWVARGYCQGRMLDLGCGEGSLLEAAGLCGIGVDLHPERLSLAARKKLRVALADGSQLPFADHSFDTVICMEVLEHVPSMAGVMSEVHRVLKPGGHWIISVPNVTLRSWYEMWRERRPYYCDEHEHYREFSPVSIPWFEHRFMRINTLDSMLTDHGFTLVHTDGVRYLFPQWCSRLPGLQRCLESAAADRFWARLPWVRQFSYWTIRIMRKVA